MKNEESNNEQNFTQEEKMQIIQSWFDEYEIKKIIFKRPDIVFNLEEWGWYLQFMQSGPQRNYVSNVGWAKKTSRNPYVYSKSWATLRGRRRDT